MFNPLKRSTKSTKSTKTVTRKFDTGRISPRNKVVAQQEANRQASLYKTGARG